MGDERDVSGVGAGRPIAVTIWAVLLTLRAVVQTGLFGYWLLFDPGALDERSPLEVAFSTWLLVAVNGATAFSLWRNERWGVLLYVVCHVILLAIVAALSNQGLVSGVNPAAWLVGLAIFVLSMVTAWDRMRGWPSFRDPARSKAADG